MRANPASTLVALCLALSWSSPSAPQVGTGLIDFNSAPGKELTALPSNRIEPFARDDVSGGREHQEQQGGLRSCRPSTDSREPLRCLPDHFGAVFAQRGRRLR